MKIKHRIRMIVMETLTPFKKISGNHKIKQGLKNNKTVKIVIGASDVYEKGWIPTDVYNLNLLRKEDWSRYFDNYPIDLALAEHVWEHLTKEEAEIAAKNVYSFLKVGGNLRVAVPDGYHQSSEYVDKVRVGGTGPGSYDHKVLYNYKTFKKVFEKAGFKTELLEYFDENKKFHQSEYSDNFGIINRSMNNDLRNHKKPLSYTSIILDATK
jgi:predicted SAM-dependent methyltransferase